MKSVKCSGYESYKVIALSTAHISCDDSENLMDMADSSDYGMIMSRDSGFFIKLYSESESNHYKELSDAANLILSWAFNQGARMVEFDCDAGEVEGLPVFAW